MDEKQRNHERYFENLTDEQKEKAKSCKSVDELMKLAGEWGFELPDDLSGMITGGYMFFDFDPRDYS